MILILLLCGLLFGCAKKDSSSSSTDSGGTTSGGTTSGGTPSGGTTSGELTSYVGDWLKSSDNRIAMSWKSDSFIYGCLVSDYTYAAHGSYSSSNNRLTWWDGSYNTVASSGSNIYLDGATYVPAILYSTCNPFWTYSTSENTYYYNASRSIGYWKFTYTLTSTWNDYPLMSAISNRRTSDYNYYTYGTDAYGNVITGTYLTSNGVHDIIDTSASSIDEYYAFTINSSNNGITSGCYYQYNKSTLTWGSCVSMSGLKIYGTPRSYRTINEKSVDEIMRQKKQEMIQVGSLHRNSKLTDKDLRAFKRYQQLLQILNSTDKEPLRTYLRSFR